MEYNATENIEQKRGHGGIARTVTIKHLGLYDVLGSRDVYESIKITPRLTLKVSYLGFLLL